VLEARRGCDRAGTSGRSRAIDDEHAEDGAEDYDGDDRR